MPAKWFLLIKVERTRLSKQRGSCKYCILNVVLNIPFFLKYRYQSGFLTYCIYFFNQLLRVAVPMWNYCKIFYRFFNIKTMCCQLHYLLKLLSLFFICRLLVIFLSSNSVERILIYLLPLLTCVLVLVLYWCLVVELIVEM